MYQVDSYGKKYDVTMEISRYQQNGGLALKMNYMDEEFGCMMPFATLTVNLGYRPDYGCAYVDTNNCPWAEDLINKNGLGVFTGKTCMSGYCEYPLYRFDLDKIREGNND